YGDQGTVSYDFSTDVVRVGKAGDKKLETLEIPADLERDWRVEEDFLAAVKSKGRVRPQPDFVEGRRYMRVVQAVADSRARNGWIDIKV
ncbi:MAG: putative dehydrogenase, partial [Spartobacteria bacterium]|nr:putative dehydrogenase [Spartobacteria bacterium]